MDLINRLVLLLSIALGADLNSKPSVYIGLNSRFHLFLPVIKKEIWPQIFNKGCACIAMQLLFCWLRGLDLCFSFFCEAWLGVLVLSLEILKHMLLDTIGSFLVERI